MKNLFQYAASALTAYRWWQVAFFIIGVVSVLSIIGALFFAKGSSPKYHYTNGPVPAVDSLDFPINLAHTVNAGLEEGGSVEILNNGDGFYPALLDSFRDAKKTINFSVYIWEDGEASDMILPVLLEKQKQGVQVRVLLDGLGSKNAPDDLFEELKASGAKVESYRTATFGKLTRYHRRNHRRSIVIDGKVGFTGGMAVSDSWLGNAQSPKHWRDMMFKVSGPMARSLQDAFVDHWASSSGEILLGEDIYPTAFEQPGSEIKFVHIASSPADDSQPMPKFLLLPMLAAKEKLYIATPYFVGDTDLMEVLRHKAHNGVDVRLMLPGKNIDNKMVRWGAQNYYQDLLEAGVKVYEYQPTFLHSKFFVVDDKMSVIGSPNLNSRSRRLDEENAMAIFDAGLAQQLSDIFVKDLELSQEQNYDQWKKRNPLIRFLQLTSRIISQQS